VPPHDRRSEQAPNAVILSKEWATLEDGRRRIHELVTRPFELSEYHDMYTDGHLKACKETLLYQKQEDVKVAIVGELRGANSHYRGIPLPRAGMSFSYNKKIVDLNPQAKTGTLRHPLNASHAIILVDPALAPDDPGTSQTVATVCERLGPDKIVVVLSESDRYDNTIIPSTTRRQDDTAQELGRQTVRLKSEVDEIDQKIQKYEDARDFSQAGLHGQQKRKLEVLMKQADNAEKAYRIHVRSEHNKAVLQEKLAGISKTAALVPIFCIHRTTYAEILAGYLLAKGRTRLIGRGHGRS
jgi:hypothetical protein